MVFDIPVTINNHKVRKSNKIRYKYKFHLNKYHQERELKQQYENSSEIINAVNNTPTDSVSRTSALTPVPSEFENENLDEHDDADGASGKKIDYETKVLSKYLKPEDQYEQWYLNSTTSETQLQSQYPQVRQYQQNVLKKSKFVHADYIRDLKHKATKQLDTQEFEILAAEYNEQESNLRLKKRIGPMEGNYMSRHIYNIIQIWHFAILDHNWTKAYKCFSILIRIPDIDIRSIWSLGCVTLKNHQIFKINNGVNGTSASALSQHNDRQISVFTFNPQSPMNASENQQVAGKDLTYMKFLEWMCTVFSSRTHFNQNTNYVKDPVWRKGSYKHTPMYVYTWLWSLLVESSNKNDSSSNSTSFGFTGMSGESADGDSVQWIIEKINDMILSPPYMDDPMVRFIQASAHLVKADELVNSKSGRRLRNTSLISQHIQSCKKILKGISFMQKDVPLDKQFYFNKSFIMKQLQTIERQIYIDSDNEDISDSNTSSQKNSKFNNSFSAKESFKFETTNHQSEDMADDSSEYNSDMYTKLGDFNNEGELSDNQGRDYSSSD